MLVIIASRNDAQWTGYLAAGIERLPAFDLNMPGRFLRDEIGRLLTQNICPSLTVAKRLPAPALTSSRAPNSITSAGIADPLIIYLHYAPQFV